MEWTAAMGELEGMMEAFGRIDARCIGILEINDQTSNDVVFTSSQDLNNHQQIAKSKTIEHGDHLTIRKEKLI